MTRGAGGLSLKARAVALLSRREHSRRELARKLAPHADSPEALSQVLDTLAAEGWQSDQRFAHSLLDRRADGRGTRRLRMELGEHGLDADLVADALGALEASEQERAQALWCRKFGAAPEDGRAWARQFRFMIARGFTPECVRRILSDPPD